MAYRGSGGRRYVCGVYAPDVSPRAIDNMKNRAGARESREMRRQTKIKISSKNCSNMTQKMKAKWREKMLEKLREKGRTIFQKKKKMRLS